MPRGRPPVPTRLKLLAGNPGRRPLNPNEAKPRLERPNCPKHLTGEARKEWRRTGRRLVELGIMTDTDRAALAAYCTAWSPHVGAEQQLEKHGVVIVAPSGFPVQSPYLAIANKAIEQMERLLRHSGMSPSMRSRVTAMRPEKPDAFADFLRRGKTL